MSLSRGVARGNLGGVSPHRARRTSGWLHLTYLPRSKPLGIRLMTALIEIPQVCLSEFPTCEQRSVYRLAGAGGGASEAIGCGVVIA